MRDFTTRALWALVQMVGTTVVFRLSDNAFDRLNDFIHATTGITMTWLQ